MRKIPVIVRHQLKEFFKSPGSVVLMLVMPVVFSLIFGGMAMSSGGNKPIVNIVVNNEEVNTRIVDLLRKNDQFEWKNVSLLQAKKNVSEQKVEAAVIIPADVKQRITDKQPLFDIMLLRKSESYLALSPHLQGTAELIKSSYQAVINQGNGSFPKLLEAITVSKGAIVEQQIVQSYSGTVVDINLMFVGFAIMFMMFGLSGAASVILDERRGGTWGRLMISPASKLQISLGYLLSYFMMGWIQFAVLMVAMNLLFDTTWGKLTYLIPFASLVVLMVVGFGLMIASLVKTKQQAMAISTVIIVCTSMLGGVYWPIEFVPEVMQKMALAVPQSWAMSGFREIISGSLHFESLVKDTLALLGFSALFFSIAVKRIKFE